MSRQTRIQTTPKYPSPNLAKGEIEALNTGGVKVTASKFSILIEPPRTLIQKHTNLEYTKE
jgi:hypothetical protein